LTEFGTKRKKFQVKRMSIRLGIKSNSFRHKRTVLSGMAVMDKKFIANLVGGIKLQKEGEISQVSV